MRQLQLDIEPQLDARIGDFSGPGWGPVIDAVRQLHAGLVNRFYVYGGAGSGKSHLLSAICDSYLEIGKTAIKVSLLELLDAPTEAITSLDQYDLVALDDIEAISGVPHWQKAVFHLINYSNEVGGQIVFSSRFAPIELKLELPDLQSRLTQAVSVKVPNGSLLADRVALIHSVLERRGIHIDQQIIDHLLLNGPHQASILLQVLEKLIQLLKGDRIKLNGSNLRQIYALIDEYHVNI